MLSQARSQSGLVLYTPESPPPPSPYERRGGHMFSAPSGPV